MINVQDASVKILVIEDDPVERMSLQAALESSIKNAYVEVVGTGSEAESVVRVQLFDVLLVDYRLPDIDGLSLIKKLKEDNGEVSAIVITGYSSVEVAVESMSIGAYDYMIKPVKIDHLVKTINSLISDKKILFDGKAKLSMMVDDSFKYLYDNQDSITVITTPDTSMLLNERPSLFRRIRSFFGAIKKYYWG